MTYIGRVQNGVVVLDNGAKLPEGSVVRVEAAEAAEAASDDAKIPSLFEQMKPLVGVVDDLPSDMARNHDHYLHGLPKK